MSTPTTPTKPKLPDGLPPLPDGAVYLRRGKEFHVPDLGFHGYMLLGGNWGSIMELNGSCTGFHYAAPADSDIARLNGHGVEPAKTVCYEGPLNMVLGKPPYEINPNWRDNCAVGYVPAISSQSAQPAADSEAVALVRKLRAALAECRGVIELEYGERSASINAPMSAGALAEAAAFLAKEETKS